METKIARCGRAIKDKSRGYSTRNIPSKMIINKSQNALAKIEREAFKKARHKVTIPDMVIIVSIIFILLLIQEARYELIRKVGRQRVGFRSWVCPDQVGS